MGLASRVALSEVSQKLKTWETEGEKLLNRIQITKEIVTTLSELKGASMKLGQLLSLDLGDYLPPEVIKILNELHQKSTFLSYEIIEEILIKELKDKFKDLSDISKEPIAAASIGQVHKANLNHKSVAIKIQYPGVADSIPNDIKIIEMILKKLILITNKRQTDISPLIEEIKSVLQNEANYQHEVMMHLRYKEAFKKSEFIIPEIYQEYSTSKIIIQEFIEGISFVKWIETNPDLKTREYFADQFIRLYLDEIFKFKLVQSDPNPGNFLITRDNKIALIDFGAVKEYSDSFVNSYRKILMASFKGDKEMILKESYKVHFIDERETEEVKNIYLEMMDYLSRPFRGNEHFDFTSRDFFNHSRDLSIEMSLKSRYSPPPKDLLFLHRKLAGVFIFLKKLDVKIRLKDYWHFVEET